MKFLVFGSGLMGSALALDLARSEGVEKVTIADVDTERARKTAANIGLKNVSPVPLDVNYYDLVIDLMSQHDCAISAVSFRFNYLLSNAAIEAGIHFCDLGGNDEVVLKQLSLDSKAKNANVAIVPNCGLAPGFANIVAARGAEFFQSVDSIKIRVGGLPQHPKPPLNYQLVFSVEGLINEYTGTSTVLREGKMTQVETMTEIETIEFPPPFGKLEAFHTSGGSSLLPRMFAGKVRELDYKTIRYLGHCEKFKALLDLGFASNEPIAVGSNLLTAKEFFYELLRKKLEDDGKDVVLMKVEISGALENNRRLLSFELIDFYDENDNITAMMRMTAFPTSIIAQMLMDGTIEQRGVFTPEYCVPLEPLLEGLHERGVNIQQQWSYG